MILWQSPSGNISGAASRPTEKIGVIKMKINMQHWAEEIINAKDVRNLPVLYFPVLKDMDMSVPESVKDPVKIATVMKKVVEEYPDTIAAITGMDLTVDAEAFGAEVNFSERQAPNVVKHIINKADEIDSLVIPDIHSGRVDVFTHACVEAEKIIKDRPVFGGMLGPFSLAANLLDINTCMLMTLKDKESLHKLIEKCNQWLINRALEYKKAGANGIFIAEPTAGLLSPKACDEFSSSYIKRLADEVQDEHFFLVLHDCGRVTKSVESMYRTGCKGFHFGNGVNMTDILPQMGQDVLVFGNLDPSSVYFMGTPDSVYEKTIQLLEEMKQYPNFVLSSGCDLAPSVEAANLNAYYRACSDFNIKNGHPTSFDIAPFIE